VSSNPILGGLITFLRIPFLPSSYLPAAIA